MSGLRVLVLAFISTVFFQFSAYDVWAGETSSGTKDKRAISPMDADFAVALHEFLAGNVANAYERLDNAIENLPPTGRWYLYLLLYRTCFDRMTGAHVPLAHSKKGMGMLQKMASGSEKSPAALAKLIILTPTRSSPDQESVYEYIRTILAKYGDSPWAQWAEWKKAEMDVLQLQKELLVTPYPLGNYHVADAAMSFKIKCVLEADRNTDNEKGIMDRWMAFRLEKGIQLCLLDLQDRLTVCKGYGPKQRDALKHLKMSCPVWVTRESRLLDIVSDTYVGDPTDIVWEYFEFLRHSFASFPRSIPKGKQELHRLYRKRRHESE